MTASHSHIHHSHAVCVGSHGQLPVTSHDLHFMFNPKLPYVHFKDEPPSLREQIEALGGSVIRHSFGTRAYNPGLAFNHFSPEYLRSDFLMTYRAQEVSTKISVSTLSLVGVNADGRVKWESQLELPSIPGEGTPMHEDGRLLWSNGALFLAFSNVRLRSDSVTFKQSLVSLTPEYAPNMAVHVFKTPFIAGPLKHLNYGNNHPLKPGHEKNWQFFDDRGEIRTVYSLNPHVVIAPANGKHHITSCNAANDWSKVWGEMHGGTPPILLPDGRFLSFFNSFIGHQEHQRRYVVGAYIFEGQDNGYRISHIVNKPILIGSEREGFLWESPVHWEPIVAFATGAVYNESTNTVRLAYGINDCFAESADINLDTLLSRMVAV